MDISDKRFKDALLIYNSGDIKKAELILEELLNYNPYHEDALFLSAELNYKKGNLDKTIELLYKLISINPYSPEIFNNLGVVLKEKGNDDEAISCYMKAIQYGPDIPDSYYNLGVIFQEKDAHDSAIMCFKKAIEFDAEKPDYYMNLAISLQKKKQYKEAETNYRRAIELNPVNADTYYNLGTLYHEIEKLDEAISFYNKAIELDSLHKDAFVNAGLAYSEKRIPEKAISYYDKAIFIEPNFADAHWNKSLSLLLLGRYEEGWKEYEWRTKTSELIVTKREFPKPLWDGSKKYGKDILLYAEQGLGDTIQFVRYASIVSNMGFNVIIEAQEELKNLIRYVKGVRDVVTVKDRFLNFDVYYPLLSLPYLFNTTLGNIPSDVPYINIGNDLIVKWNEKLKIDKKRFNVGIVWSGNSNFKKAHLKRCPLEKLSPLFENNNISFYSLQKFYGEDYKIQKNIRLIDYMDEVNDFLDTACIIMNLDLIISVDTAVAHLAGALGKPVWVLIPYVPDWRWMLDREDSPWYPTMRLFRQSVPKVWDDVIERIRIELDKLSI